MSVAQRSSVARKKSLEAVAAPLFDQQCFCWGEDIRRPGGNLLLAYGFARERAGDRAGCSRYRLALENGAILTLWGFGAHIGFPDGTGIVVSRDSFAIRLTDRAIPSDAWLWPELEARKPLSNADVARTAHHLLALVDALCSYEVWIESNYPAWRKSTVGRWFKKRVPATKIVPTWSRVRTLSQGALVEN